MVRLHGRIAQCRWHLTLSSSFAMCIDQTYCYLSHKYHWESFCNHFSLCTKVVQKLNRNGPPSCTEVVQADSTCSSCTEIGLYRSRPPPCPEVVMYRTGPNPCKTGCGFQSLLQQYRKNQSYGYKTYFNHAVVSRVSIYILQISRPFRITA